MVIILILIFLSILCGSTVSIMVQKSTVPKNEETDNERIESKVKKGDRVVTTGYGRTKDWGNIKGIVSQNFLS